MRLTKNIVCAGVALLLIACAAHTILAYMGMLSMPCSVVHVPAVSYVVLPYIVSILACVVAIVAINNRTKSK